MVQRRFVEPLGVVVQRAVDVEDFEVNRCRDVGRGFDRFDDEEGFAFVYPNFTIRKFDEDNVTELFSRKRGDPHAPQPFAFGLQPLVRGQIDSVIRDGVGRLHFFAPKGCEKETKGVL